MTYSPHHDDDDTLLNRDGDLVLPEDLEQVADRLRRDADALARRAMPHAAFRGLVAQLPVRRRSWVYSAAAGAMMMVGLSSLGASAFFWWTVGNPRREQVTGARMQGRASVTERRQVAAPRIDGDAGEGADDPSHDGPAPRGAYADFVTSIDPVIPQLTEPVSDAERIEMLERALESYRAAILAQQDRIRDSETKLRRAEQEITRLRALRDR